MQKIPVFPSLRIADGTDGRRRASSTIVVSFSLPLQTQALNLTHPDNIISSRAPFGSSAVH